MNTAMIELAIAKRIILFIKFYDNCIITKKAAIVAYQYCL
ncbi:hypothetical protein B4168_1849 [Anoxybacillus flavithermus]|nr:hypothetical protein B4168_1849 [Anoxybacillus flavithermus]OAO85505.1 hypothetical protein GT23_2408 [Parageobacillus thermoglucosidasius]